MQPLGVSEDGKPLAGYRYWSCADTMRWLSEACDAGFCPERIPGPAMDTRVHLEVSQQGVAEEGKLFSTTMAAFESYTLRPREPAAAQQDRWSLLCRVTSQDVLTTLYGPGRFGGENRIAVIESSGTWPVCLEPLRRDLTKATYVRMLLATPALFEHGWKPAWIDRATGVGSPPGIEGVRLELLSAAVPRRIAISGWDLVNKRSKPIRYCAPAGSVYFFRVLEGSRPALLADEGWLAGVSDIEAGVNAGEQLNNNRNDGFGLALWGTWSAEEHK
jgi:CRISPR-associated protein Cmr3